MDHTSGYRYPRSATAGYLSSNYRSITGGPTSNLQTSNYGRSATSGDYLLYKGSTSRSPSNGPHLRAFSANNSPSAAPVPQTQETHAYLSGSASAAYQRRYERRRKEAAALSGEGQGNYNESDSTPVTPSGTRYRGEGRSNRYSKVEGILSPTRITSPPRETTHQSQHPAVHRDPSPNSNQYYQRGSAAVRDVRSHHSVQSPDGMSTNDGVSSVPSSTVDSGYTPSSAATPDNASGGLWNQLGEGMTSTSPSSSRNPGAFLFGGKVGGAHNEQQGFDTDSGVSHGGKSGERGPGAGKGVGTNVQQAEFEPDAEAAMNSMTSIKKELERKIGQLEAERDNVAKAGLSKYKQHLLDQRIMELDAQLKTLHLSHNALQSAAKKSEQVVEHTSQAIRMMEHDTTSFEKVKQVMSKEISVLKEALRLSKERTEKLENDVTVAESGARNVDALQDKLATAQTERDKAVMRAERLNSEVKKLTDEVNVLKKNEQELSQKMAASRDVFELRRSEMLKTKNELRAMESESSSIKQQNEELLNKLETIETELKHSKSVGEEREMALHQSDALLKEMKKKLQDVESSAKLLDEYEDKLSRAEMAIEERETQIKNLKQQVNRKSNHFHNLTLEQEKSRKLEKEIETLTHQLSESDDMIKLLREQKTILAKSIEPGKISEPYQVQIDHLMAELSLANDKMQELERIRDKLVQEKVDMVSGAGIPVVSGLLKYKQTGVVDFHHGIHGPGGVEGGAGGHSGGACQNCGYWKEKHDQLRNINKELNEQLTQLGSQHNTLKDVVRSVTPYLEKANTETADILGELDDLRRQLAEKEGELVEAKRAVDALHDQVKYLKQQLNPDSGNEDLLGGSGTNMSLNGTVENWTTNYEDLKMKLKALKKHFQHMASLRVEETDVFRCNDSGISMRRLLMDKNFQMDTRLRDCEVVHTEIEQMIFNINMKLSKYSTYKDQSHRLQEHTKHLNGEINQLFAANEKLERENQSLKDNLQKRINSAGAQVMLEKDGQLVEMKKILDLKDKEIESLRNSQNGWITERNSLKAKTDELQTSLRAKEKMVEEYAEKVSNQDLQIVGLRHEMKELNCQVTETKMQMSQQNLPSIAAHVQHHAGIVTSTSTEFNPHSTCWVTCTECGHVIELTVETLDLTSRVSGLKEMVKKLKKENEELCLQNENFNVQLSTSRSQLLQLNHKLNTTGHQLTIYKRAAASYDQLRYSNEKLCRKLSSITGQTVSKDARRFSFSGIPGGCDKLLEMDSPSKLETSSAATISGSTLNFHPGNKVHIKPQPPRSHSLNRLEEYKSIPYSVPNLDEAPMKDVDIEAIESYCNEAQNIISQKTAGSPASKSQTYPAANQASRSDDKSVVDPNKATKEGNQSAATTASASGVLSQALRQRISRIPSPVPGRRSPLPKPIPQKQVPPSITSSTTQERPTPNTPNIGRDDTDGGIRTSNTNHNSINSDNNVNNTNNNNNNSRSNVTANRPALATGSGQPQDPSIVSMKGRPPSPVPALVRMRSNPSLRTSNESIDNSHSEATTSSVAPKISGKQPMASHRQMTAGLKTASVLAKKLKNNNTAPQPQKKMMGLTLESKNDPKTASLKSLDSKSDADNENPRQKQSLMTSWDDVSVDDTNRDVSSASDLPDDDSVASHEQGESTGDNTSSDSRGSASNSPNASMSALHKMSSSSQGSLPGSKELISESNPGSEKSTPIIASRPNLASKPAAKQKDKLASEQANKLSVRATENVPAAITTALMRSRTPNSVQSAQVSMHADGGNDVSENSADNDRYLGNASGQNRERRIAPDGRTPAGSNVSGDGRSMRPNTVVYNPNNPTQRPSIRSQEKVEAVQVGRNAPIAALPAKRAISVSPQQKPRSPLANSGVQGNRTPVFIPGSNSRNDSGNSQVRLRSQSAEAMGGPVGTNWPLGNAASMGPQSKSPSISAIQQAKRQFISDGPVTSSPKPVRSPKSMNMTPSSSLSTEMMMSSTEMKEPWPLDEIDTALDKLLKEDKFLTEAEVTNAIDKELEAISIAKSHGNDKRVSNTPRPGAVSSASTRNVTSANRSTPISSNSSLNSRTNPQESDRRQTPQQNASSSSQSAAARSRPATPSSSRVPRPFSPSIARIRQVQQQVEAEDASRGHPPGKMNMARSAPHAARRQPTASSGNAGSAEQGATSRRGGPSNASSSGGNNSNASSRKVHYL